MIQQFSFKVKIYLPLMVWIWTAQLLISNELFNAPLMLMRKIWKKQKQVPHHSVTFWQNLLSGPLLFCPPQTNQCFPKTTAAVQWHTPLPKVLSDSSQWCLKLACFQTPDLLNGLWVWASGWSEILLCETMRVQLSHNPPNFSGDGILKG